jgi:N-formylglutamate amidohydrolase
VASTTAAVLRIAVDRFIVDSNRDDDALRELIRHDGPATRRIEFAV